MTNGPTQNRGEFSDEEQSDLFSIKGYNPGGTSIPPIKEVPLTPEEKRRRLILRVIYTVAAVVTLALATWITVRIVHNINVSNAVAQASHDGRIASIQEAIELMEGDGDEESRALTLRLRSMLVLAGAEESQEEITAALNQLPEDGEPGRQRGIAETYMALARGDLQGAMDKASRVVASGDYAAEAARARALAAYSVGNVEQALAAAQIAVDQSPDSPRHVAIFAELTARNGDAEAGLSRLDELAEDQQNAATRIARARIRDSAGAEIDQVAELAQTVLDDEQATPHEQVWARLLLARAAAKAGDRVTARRHLDQAAEEAPPGDELFTLGLCEAALRIGADHLARTAAERLPAPLSVDAHRRAQLGAELALVSHDLRAAELSLRHAPAGPRTAVARARLLEARGQFDQARELYESAAREGPYRVVASVRLANMELRRGNASEASERVEPLLQEFPNHPDVIPVAVEAQLGLNAPQVGMRLVTPALSAHPEDVRLLAAKAHVQMALEQWEQALATLDRALEIEDDDANLHADRGRAAHQLNRLEVARQAYDAALALNELHPDALVGRLDLDVNAVQPAQARQIMDRIERAEVSSERVDRLQARLLVMEGAGQSGVRAVRRALRRNRSDQTLNLALGWLFLQAEQYSPSVRAFASVRNEDDTPHMEAILGRAFAQIRARASNPAEALLEVTMRSVSEASLEAPLKAELHAVRGWLAWSDENRRLATREARRALELDSGNTTAHFLLADIENEADRDATSEWEASVSGPHPVVRAMAHLALRSTDPPTEAMCNYARRYREAAPAGSLARAVHRVERACR